MKLIFSLLCVCFLLGVQAFEVQLRAKDQKDLKKVSLTQMETSLDQELGLPFTTLILPETKGYRVKMRTETSVTIMGEGPHIDLVEWHHGFSPWIELKLKEGEFILENEEKKAVFPKVSKEYLIAEVLEEGGERWAKMATECKDFNSYPCGISVSRFHLKIEKKDEGSDWYVLKKLVIVVPMGC